MKSFLLLLFAVASIATAYADRYCDMGCTPDPKKPPIQHIACNHNKNFAASCQATAKLVPLDSALQKFILDLHNTKRNHIAGGGEQNFGRACRMATMSWDKELADHAELNVKQCVSQHDFCHSTSKFKYTGQNLHMEVKCPVTGYNNKDVFEKAFKGWYDEITEVKPNFIDKLPQFAGGGEWRHFTTMMREPSTHVGCAAAVYTTSENKYGARCPTPVELEVYLIACNYATTNIYGLPLYTKCANSGEKCKKKNTGSYPNLCDVNEEYDVNNITS